ncbi:hypothetical protein [Almyronema epifaneia]|uniref:Uncharacterized protein n=1 Tax=Almyronema epifaneia S1 TaxID=2991925 RepID=A0ABW6IHL6_9CYAN
METTVVFWALKKGTSKANFKSRIVAGFFLRYGLTAMDADIQHLEVFYPSKSRFSIHDKTSKVFSDGSSG